MSGYETDEQKRAQINQQVSILWIGYGWYEHAFAPGVRRRILYKDPSITSIASLIFDSSEHDVRRPVRTVAAATRLESPAREGALSILASALALYVLSSPGSGNTGVAAIYDKLQPLMHYVIGQLLSDEKFEQLKDWMARAKIIFPAYPRKDVEQKLDDFAERLINIESIVLRSERDKDRQGRLRALLKNMLEVLRGRHCSPEGLVGGS